MGCWWNSPMGQVLSLRPAWRTQEQSHMPNDMSTHTKKQIHVQKKMPWPVSGWPSPPPCQSRTPRFSHFASSLHYRLQLRDLPAWFLLNDKLLLATTTSGAIFWFWVIQNTTVVRKQRRESWVLALGMFKSSPLMFIFLTVVSHDPLCLQSEVLNSPLAVSLHTRPFCYEVNHFSKTVYLTPH